MYFVNPYFLFAGLLIAIPVIIHLFNFRRYKKVYFSNVEFLKEIQLKTQKSSQLRHLLVLISRILAILCLVFAFAQPYIPVSDKNKVIQKNNIVSIYIDNSYSMDAINGNGRLFDEAKNKALEIASAYKQSDLFQVLTNDFEGKHQRLVTIDEFKQMVSEIKISSVSRKLSEISSRQADMLNTNNSKSKNAYIISDFQQNICDVSQLPKDIGIKYYLIPVKPNEISNVYIDSIWFDSPARILEQRVKLHVKIRNISKNDLDKIPVRLSINNKQRAVSSVNINANSSTEIIVPFTIIDKGINNCSLEITDYPISFDNAFYFSYNVSSILPILSINQKDDNLFINSLFSKDSLFSLTNSTVKSIDYSSFRNYTLIILNGLNSISSGLSLELINYINNGGNIAVFPGEDADIESYQNFLKSVNSVFYITKDTAKTKISEINITHNLLNDVFEKIPENADLPSVFKHYVINIYSHSGAESLLKLQNNDNFLVLQSVSKGKIYLFASPLDIKYSNFPRHSLFVPTLYKMALLSQSDNKLFYSIQKDDIIQLYNYIPSGENIIKVKKINSDFEIIPEYRNNGVETDIILHNQIKEAGNYTAVANDNILQGLSYNYDRKESEMKYFDTVQLLSMIDKAGLKNYNILEAKNKPLAKALSELNYGIRLWKWFIVFSLIFLGVEIVLLRFLKK